MASESPDENDFEDVVMDVLSVGTPAKGSLNDPNLTDAQQKSLIKTENRRRRVEAMTLRIAGLTFAQIGDRLGISATSAAALVNKSLERADVLTVERLRQIENERLDKAQVAIWPRVLKGDEKAIGAFLRISDRRSRINGMDAPTRVELSMTVRTEMEQALEQLEALVLEQEYREDDYGVIDAELEP